MRSLGCNRELRVSSIGKLWGPVRGQLLGRVVRWGSLVGLFALSRLGQAATPLSVSLGVDLDGDGQTETATLDESGLLTVSGGPRFVTAQQLKMELGERYHRITEPTLTEQRTGSGQRFVVATGLRAAGQRWALWGTVRDGKLVAAYSGPIGPVGSDGEYSLGIGVVDGVLLRYQTAPTIERCDGERRLFVERYGPDGRWQPDRLLPKLDGAAQLSTTTVAPTELPSIPLGIYRLVATNRQAGIERADLLTAPRELDDGQPQTAWRGLHDARGTFFTWRAEFAGRSLRAVRISPPLAVQGNLPTQLILTVSPQQSFRISTAGLARPFWVVLPQPVSTSCVSLTVENGGTREGQWSALGEVNLFSDLDGGDAVTVLTTQLGAAEMRTAEAAERALSVQIESGTPRRLAELTDAISAALPTSRGSTKRRLHALLAKLCSRVSQLGSEKQKLLLETLLTTLGTAEVEERPPLLVALTTLANQTQQTEAIARALVAVVQDPGSSSVFRGQVLGWLVERAPLGLVLTLGQDLSTVSALRETFVESLGRRLRCISVSDPQWSTVRTALEAARQSPEQQALILAALGEAMTGCKSDEGPREVAEQVTASWRSSADLPDEESRFALRYRLLKTLARLELVAPPSLLGEILRDEKQPELRQLAARALARSSSVDAVLLSRGLADTDAGVRLGLLSGLVGRRDGTLTALLAPIVKGDPWPMVRRAAVEVLGGACQPGSASVAVFEQALADSDEGVAALTLQGLSRCLGSSGLARYQALLVDGKTLPSVRGQACVLVARHGLVSTASAVKAHQAIGEGLGDLIDDPQAADRSLVAAVLCIRALGEHGDGSDLGLLLARLERDAPLALRRGAVESVLKICQRQRAPLGKEDRQGLSELLRQAGEPSDGLLHGLQPKLKAACGPWSSSR